jgi:hypothetical protein
VPASPPEEPPSEDASPPELELDELELLELELLELELEVELPELDELELEEVELPPSSPESLPPVGDEDELLQAVAATKPRVNANKTLNFRIGSSLLRKRKDELSVVPATV